MMITTRDQSYKVYFIPKQSYILSLKTNVFQLRVDKKCNPN